MSQEPHSDAIELGRQLHRGRVYLALAAFTFLGLVGLIYLSDDAMLDTRRLHEEDQLLVQKLVLDRFYFNMKLTAPLFVLLLVAAALMVWRRLWWFILLMALCILAYTAALFLHLVDTYAIFQVNLKAQEWFPGQRQVNDFQWFQIGAMGLATLIGFVAATAVIDVLCRPDVEEAFGLHGATPVLERLPERSVPDDVSLPKPTEETT